MKSIRDAAGELRAAKRRNKRGTGTYRTVISKALQLGQVMLQCGHRLSPKDIQIVRNYWAKYYGTAETPWA